MLDYPVWMFWQAYIWAYIWVLSGFLELSAQSGCGSGIVMRVEGLGLDGVQAYERFMNAGSGAVQAQVQSSAAHTLVLFCSRNELSSGKHPPEQ